MRLLDRLTGASRAVPAGTVETGLMETWRMSPGRDAPAFDFVSMVQDGYQSNGIVFSVILARMSLFSEAEVKFRRLSDKALFGTPDLAPLETPWAGGTTGELLARMEQHASLGGQALVVRDGDGVKLLRPDWVRRVSELDSDGQRRLLGYLYDPTGWTPGGPDGVWEEPVYYLANEVACYAPVPDPLNPWRGMSWLTPVIREINGDAAMNTHKEKFFENAATPNIVIRYQKKLPDGYVKAFAEQFDARHGGVGQSWRTVILDEAADLTVVGSSFEQMTFTDLQAAGETRIAAAGGVPPIIAGLREGLASATYSNYATAMRRFADLTMRPNWRLAMGALSVLVNVPAGAKLWYDTTDIAALQEGEKERADAAQVNAATLNTLITAGFTAESATRAVIAGDFSLLQHSGLVSVQLQPPGAQQAPTAAPAVAGRSESMELVEYRDAPNRRAVDVTVNIPEPPPMPEPAPIVIPAPVVNVTVEPTPVTVNVEPAAVNVAAPSVTVEPTPVTVNVEPTPVTVQLPDEKPKKTTTVVERDPRTGLITKTTATEREG